MKSKEFINFIKKLSDKDPEVSEFLGILNHKFDIICDRLERLEKRELKAPTCQKLNDRIKIAEQKINCLEHLDERRKNMLDQQNKALDDLIKQAQELKMGYPDANSR